MEIKFKRDTAFRKTFFVPDSFAHPAKMDAQLLIWIVGHYTEAGETILDPMAGSGTTMLACGLGRNVVLVELEERFCKMMRDNWEEVRMRPQLGSTMGTCQIIQGDARQLEGLVDKIVTSPPFAEALTTFGKKGKREDSLKSQETREIGRIKHRDNYKDVDTRRRDELGRWIPDGEYVKDRQNIGNLPYGEIDKCIFSPPFAGQSGGLKSAESFMYGKDNVGKRMMGGIKGGTGESPNNIDHLPYGQIDKIVTSPPYEEAMGKKHHSPRADKLAQEKSNPTTYIGVDSIITSPPYENQGQGQGNEYHPERMVGSETGLGRGYGDNAGNIGNLKSQSYLEAMLQVYQQCYKVLKPQGLMILVTKNFIRNKAVVRLDTDTIKLCEQAGFSYLERHYRKLPSQSFWRLIYHQKHPEVEQILNEDVLVFNKQTKE